jgi:hypothetical protein
MKMKITFFAVIATLLSITASAEMSNREIANASQNPITMIYSMPIQNNINFDLGDSGETKNIANIQPVVPMDLTENWDMVWRLILPVVTSPVGPNGINEDGEITGFDDTVTGLGDSTLTMFIAPKHTEKFIWGAGAELYMPTATEDALKTKQWGAGLSFVGLRMTGRWTYGALIMNVWSFGAKEEYSPNKIDFMQFQPFVNYNMGDGWFLTTVPFIMAYWDADSDNRWVVPIGGGVGKGFKIGKIPVSATAQAYYNVVTPEAAGETWQLRLQAQIFFLRK